MSVIGTNIANATTNNKDQMNVSNPQKQSQMEKLAYLKAHLDVVAVFLTIAFLSYSIIQLKKKIG